MVHIYSRKALHPLHVFLKKSGGNLYVNMTRNNYRLRIELDELPHLAEMIVHYYVATGGKADHLNNLDNVIEDAIKTHRDYQEFKTPEAMELD